MDKLAKVLADEELDEVTGGQDIVMETSAVASSTCPKCKKVIPGEEWVEHMKTCFKEDE